MVIDEPSLSTPAFGYVLKIVTSRSDCGKGSGRSRMELITAKIARFAPRQIATVASTVTVNAGAWRSWRKANRRSFMGSKVRVFVSLNQHHASYVDALAIIAGEGA